jgi:hypothetical protein
MGCEVIAFAQPYRKATSYRVAGNTHAVYTTTNHQDIDLLNHHTLRSVGAKVAARGKTLRSGTFVFTIFSGILAR